MPVLIGILMAIGTAFISFWGLSVYLGPDDIKGCEIPVGEPNSRCEKADAVVAISGGDTAARTAEAIRLYQDGWADILIFSGAARDTDSPSNALVMKRAAVDAGVPEDRVLIEESARDTSENAQETRRLASSEIRRIILVTSAYHQRRASMIFKEEFKDVEVVNHPVPADTQWSMYWWMTPEGWWLALSELVKIAYMSLGWTNL